MKVLSTGCDEQFSQIIELIVCGFKIIGLAPFSLQQIKKSAENSRRSYCTSVFLISKIGLVYNILLLILSLVLSALAIPQLYFLTYPNKSFITQAIDMMQAILRTFTACIIIIFWGLRQKKAVTIMNRLLEVDCLLSGMKTDPSSGRSSFKFLAVHMFFDTLLWATFWATEAVYIESFFSLFIFNVPIFIIHWYVVEYSIVIGLVARELETLNNILLNFKEFPDYYSPRTSFSNECLTVLQSLPTHDELTALELLHSIRTTLSDVSQDIADFFSFPILPVVACFSLTLIYNLNFLITPLVISSGDIPIYIEINVVMWILASVYPLLLLLVNVTETLKKAKQTGLIVHKLLATARKRELQTELERFSLHLIHEDLSFTANGFFTLDFTLMQSIFGATVTYLVIIIQFMQSAAYATKNTSP